MKDKWINSGYDGEELKPHVEPVEDYSDPARIGESACLLFRFKARAARMGSAKSV